MTQTGTAMRILQLTDYFWPNVGGVEIAESQVAAALVEEGHEVMVITDTGNTELPAADVYRGIEVRRFPLRRALSAGSSPRALFDLLASVQGLAQDFRPDVLHLTMIAGPTLFLAARLADAPGAPPLVASFHREVQESEKAGPDTLLGRVLGRARVVLCVAEKVRRQVVELSPEVEAKLQVVYMGLEDPGPPLPLPSGPVLLCLGRLVEDKGFDRAVDVFARLATRWPDLELRIAGEGPDLASLEQRAQALGVTERVTFLGPVAPQAVPALLAAASLVLLPSRTEALPLVGIESALAGRPAVAMDVGGMSEAVLDGETGALVPAGDIPAFASAVEALLRDPEELARRGRAARSFAEQRFLLAARVEAYSRLYRSVREAPEELIR